MAEQAPMPASLAEPQERVVTICIKTSDVEHPTILQNVRLGTTVAELRSMIREQSPLHPAEDRQRLIFHGRPLLRPDATLADALREPVVSSPQFYPHVYLSLCLTTKHLIVVAADT